MSELNRREFVAAAVVAACACLTCPMESLAAPAAAAGPLDVGALADYAKDGISDKFIKSNRLAVIRSDGKIFACTAVCTHKARVLNVEGDHFKCPGHGSEFSIQGTVTKKPAQSSLVRYEIKKNDAGHLIVNPGKSFREKDWDKADAFVTAPQ